MSVFFMGVPMTPLCAHVFRTGSPPVTHDASLVCPNVAWCPKSGAGAVAPTRNALSTGARRALSAGKGGSQPLRDALSKGGRRGHAACRQCGWGSRA